MGLRFSAPLAANARMENLFERLLFGRAFEDYGPKGRAIQASSRKNSGPKLTPELLLYLRVKIDKVARGLIGIKKFRIRQDLAQAIAKARFACRNPARDSDGRHKDLCVVAALVSSAEIKETGAWHKRLYNNLQP